MISATLDANGGIVHLNDIQLLTFGELDGSRSRRIEAIDSALSGAGSTRGSAKKFGRTCGRNGSSSPQARA